MVGRTHIKLMLSWHDHKCRPLGGTHAQLIMC